MLPEIGQLSLSLAWSLAIVGALVGLLGFKFDPQQRLNLIASVVVGQFVFSALAFVLLVTSFVNDDFSVSYVATHSNSLLPWYYKISATWGGHEGSFLLWILTMTVWMVAVSLRRKHYPKIFISRALGVMCLINIGFIAFALFTSNPFTRLIPMTPADGSDLNPLLQDFGLIVHPPMLYAGYIGLSVPFAFAIAGLLGNQVDSVWARWTRTWSNCAWAFLTVGIALGSWWAYYELGWGGWWFWDPSENASFMPWLAATALIHSLAVTEKRGTFKSWTLLLAIAGFSLSLLGAFIIRSGVLTSVHAFAVDPQRGIFILSFLGIVVGSSLTLYGFRASQQNSAIQFTWLSREFFMLINNVIFVVSLAVVLWGTLAPIGYQLTGAHISIGAPFFNAFFVPLMLCLGIALGMLPLVNWKRTQLRDVQKLVVVLLSPAIVVAVIGWWFIDPKSIAVALSLGIAVWILVTHCIDWYQRGWRVPLSYFGMTVAHLGFAMSLVGVAVTATQSVEQDVRMEPGQTVALGSRAVTFELVKEVRGPNYVAQQAVFTIQSEDGSSFKMYPEKRRYLAGGNIMTEAGIRAGLVSDTYISMGEPLPNGGWAIRLHLKPLVRWVWLGALFMAFGAIVAIFDVRYKRLRRRLAERKNEVLPSSAAVR